MDRGHSIVGVEDGFRGLLDGRFREMDWMSVSGWVSRAGVELGTNRTVPTASQLPRMAEVLSSAGVDGLLVIGGWAGYETAHLMATNAPAMPALGVPVVCVPASINNHLPASDLSIGSDTALNNIMEDVDKIKEATVAARRVFIVEVMGHECGYLALMSGLTTGAERVYIPEEGLTLEELLVDLDSLRREFSQGERRGLLVMGEGTDDLYTTGFIESLFSHESRGYFDVRSTILGHVQQGGAPSPFDRIQATRLASAGVEHLIGQANSDHPMSAMVGLRKGKVAFTSLSEFPFLVESGTKRPKDQSWWMDLRPVADIMAMRTGA
jgi:6-phosphofructokinase 1